MDLELEEINRLCDELSVLEKEEIEYRKKKNTELGIYLILSFHYEREHIFFLNLYNKQVL